MEANACNVPVVVVVLTQDEAEKLVDLLYVTETTVTRAKSLYTRLLDAGVRRPDPMFGHRPHTINFDS